MEIMTKYIKYKREIDELIKNYKCFKFLEGISELTEEDMIWYRNENESYDIQVMFIGKSGYGKSSTLNAIIGKEKFKTDDVEPCTKFLYCADFRLNTQKDCYLSFCDLPGIGEAREADIQYYEWYRRMLKKSHCVVYLLRADQRDFSVDEILFNSMFSSAEDRDKVILAINYADKVEPVDREYSTITPQQEKNLKLKLSAVIDSFKIDSKNVLYYSAKNLYNLDFLVQKIAKVLENKFM